MSPWLKAKLAAIRTSTSRFQDQQPAFLEIPFPLPGKLWVSLPAAHGEVSGFPPRPRPSPRGGTCSLLSAGSPPRGQSPRSAAACSGASGRLGPWHTGSLWPSRQLIRAASCQPARAVTAGCHHVPRGHCRLSPGGCLEIKAPQDCCWGREGALAQASPPRAHGRLLPLSSRASLHF